MTFPPMRQTAPPIGTAIVTALLGIAPAACSRQGYLSSPTAPTLVTSAVADGPSVTGAANAAPTAAGGGSATALTLLSGGFVTEFAQRVSIVSDSGRKIELHADQSAFQDVINLANTIAAGVGSCATDPPNVPADRKRQLLARMADALQHRHFNAVVDKHRVGGASDTHSVAHTWTEPDGMLFSLRIGAATELLPGASATVTEPSRDVFVYSGGAARIVDRTGPTRDHVYMACPNLDTVTVTLTR